MIKKVPPNILFTKVSITILKSLCDLSLGRLCNVSDGFLAEFGIPNGKMQPDGFLVEFGILMTRCGHLPPWFYSRENLISHFKSDPLLIEWEAMETS